MWGHKPELQPAILKWVELIFIFSAHPKTLLLPCEGLADSRVRIINPCQIISESSHNKIF
jgi:hypothetical protein